MIFFYEAESRRIQKMNKVLQGVELTKAEERTFIWLTGWEESTVDNLLSVIEKVARIRATKLKFYALCISPCRELLPLISGCVRKQTA